MVGFVVDGMVFWPVGVPLAAAALTILLGRTPTLQRAVMEGGVVVMAIASVALLVGAAGGEVRVMNFGGWSAPFGISFVGDRLAAALVTVTSMIAVAVMIHARADVGERRRRAGFDPLFLAMLAAVNGAFLTGDLFNLYVWFELMLVTALGLLTLDRRHAQMDASIRYAAMSMLGATFILLGIGFIYGEVGSLNMADLAGRLASHPPSITLTTAGYLLLAGFALKTGLFPLFFWLPTSYHTAPVAVLAALAGLLTKVGFYGMLRVFVLVFGVGGSAVIPGIPSLLGAVAAVTMLVSVVAAIAQVDLRRLLGYHILAQVAFPVMGLALASFAGVTAAIFYMLHTMLVQTGLFLAAGAVARASGSHDMRQAGGLMEAQPLFAGLFAVLAFSMIGLPPFSGFWAKLLVIAEAFRQAEIGLGVVALAVSFLTLYSLSIVWSQAFWKAPPRPRPVPRRIPPAMVVSVGFLAACTLGIGLAVEPVTAYVRAAAGQLMGGVPGGGLP